MLRNLFANDGCLSPDVTIGYHPNGLILLYILENRVRNQRVCRNQWIMLALKTEAKRYVKQARNDVSRN